MYISDDLLDSGVIWGHSMVSLCHSWSPHVGEVSSLVRAALSGAQPGGRGTTMTAIPRWSVGFP